MIRDDLHLTQLE